MTGSPNPFIPPFIPYLFPPFAFPPPPPPSDPDHSFKNFIYGLMLLMFALILAYVVRKLMCEGKEELPETSDQISEDLVFSTFKYCSKVENQALDNECSVCLSVFEDGEDIRQLVECKHLFHIQCIDMWLQSHSNCPLCRCIVGPPLSRVSIC